MGQREQVAPRILEHQCSSPSEPKPSNCHLLKSRVKFSAFNGCFPERNGKPMSMSDIDGVIEDNGRFLFLEWKHVINPASIWNKPKHEALLGKRNDAQRILYCRLTSNLPNSTVYVIGGRAETMTIFASQHFRKGKLSDPIPESLESFRAKLKKWSNQK
jgi:hypothetical protein